MPVKTLKHSLPALSAVAVAVLLGACDSASSGPDSGAAEPRLSAQAVDGYLVESQVLCDDEENGKTGLAGRFDCPLETEIFTVRGGMDVGFDVNARTGELFVGALKAPATLAHVTPLSTLAVDMSTGANGRFDVAAFGASVRQIATVLGQSDLDLGADPATTMQLVRLNAQINKLVAEFGSTADDYALATATLGEVLAKAAADGDTYDLVESVGAIAELLNAGLVVKGKSGKTEAELAALVDKVQIANRAIGTATSPDAVTAVVVATQAPAPVLTIDRDTAFVRYSTTADTSLESITLASFESDSQSGPTQITLDGSVFDAYDTVLTGDTDRLEIGTDAFDVVSSLSGTTVTLGFELEATGATDSRYFSVVTSDATITTNAQSDAMTLSIDAGSTLNVRSIDEVGTIKSTTVTLDKSYTFASENEGINVSFWDIDEQLDEEGFGNVTDEAGNFRLTAVIGDLRIGESEQGTVSPARAYTVTAGNASVSGAGFRGYVTFVPPAGQ